MPLLDIDQKICEIIGECLEKEIGEADLESTLNDLEIDSIQFIRLVVQCETVFEMPTIRSSVMTESLVI